MTTPQTTGNNDTLPPSLRAFANENADGNIELFGTTAGLPEGAEINVLITDDQGNSTTATATVTANSFSLPNIWAGMFTSGNVQIYISSGAVSDQVELPLSGNHLQEPVTITSAEFDANGLIDAAGTAPALLPGTVLSVIVRDQNDASVTATATVGADGAFSVQDVSTQGLSAGTLTFDVLAQDSNGMLSLLNVATLELSNDVPLGADATLTATEDQDYVLSASDFGYVAAQGRVLTGVKVAALPAPGTLKLNGVDVVVDQVISKADLDDGKLVFKSALDGNGSNYAKFKFKVQDSRANNNEDPIANTLTFNVTAENDPAIIAGDLTASLTETNAVESMTGTLTITDVDSPLTFAAQTDTAGTGGYGKFSLTTAGVWTYTMNSAQNQFVAGQSYIDKFTAVSSDGTSKEVTVTITGTNDAPVLADTSLAIAAVLQGSGVTPTGVKGILVSDLVGGITDADTGAAKGIAITGVNTAKGQLYYSLDGGTNWTELTDATLSTARLLKADADNRIYFKPAAGTLGDVTDAITFRAWDTTTGTDGQTGNASVNDGTTAFSKDSDTVSEYVVAPVTINAVSVDNLVNGSEPLVLTGKADPNAVVTLNINGQTTNVTAGPTGDWSFDGSKVRYVMVRKTLQNLAENNPDFNANGVMTVGDVSVMSGGVNVALNAVQSTSNRAAFLYTNGNYYDQSLHDGTVDTFAEAYGFAVPGGAGGDVWVQLDLGGWYSVDSIDVRARASLGGRLNGTKVYASPNDMSGLTQAQLDASWVVSTANTITGLAAASSGTYSVVSPVAVPASVLAEGDNVITASELVRGVSSQATATVTLDILAPTTTVLTAALSNDNGTSSTDFITTVAAQTISGTLSANLAADEKVMVSMDNGTTWVQASATVGTSTWTLPGVTLSGSNTMLAKVVDTAGNGSTPYSQTYAYVPVSNLTVGITRIEDNAGTASTVLSGGTTNDTTPTLVGTLGGATQGAALGTNEVVNVYRTPNLAVATVVQAGTMADEPILSGNALTHYINGDGNYGPTGNVYLPTSPANGDMVVITKGSGWGIAVYAGSTLVGNVGTAGVHSGGTDNLYFKWDAAKGTWLTGTNAMVKVGTATVTTNAAGQSTWTLTDNSGLGNSDSVLYVAQVENTTGTFGQQSTPGAFDWRYTVDNVAPQAVADEVTGNEDTASLTGTVASNDTRKDGTEAYTLEGSSNGTLAGTHGTLQLNPNGSYTYTRTANLDAISATATDTFTYKVTDGVGNSTTATLTVKMDPVNDAPVLTTGSTLAYTENGAAAAINTAITVADVDNATLKSATVTISGGYVSGQDTLSFTKVPATMGDIAGVLSGATMTLTSASGMATKAQWQTALRAVAYNNTSDNPTTAARTVSYVINDGTATATASSAAVTSTINLTAVNDPATIGGPVLKTLTESDVVQTATGTLTIADPDSPLTFVQQIDTVGTGGYGKFSITTAGVWTYTMDNAHNEFVDAQVYTDTFTVSSADGTMQMITVKITGTNDSAAITGINTATITQNTVAQTVSDTLLISDVDSPTTFVAQTNTPGENNYGKFSLTTAGVWTYTMNSAQTQLVGGTSYTDSFTATSADGTTKKVTVTINGTNDAAVIAGDLTKSLTETNAVESVTGTLSITDPDSPLTFAAQTNTPGTAGYGKFSLTTAGVWTYTMDSAQNQFVAGQSYIDKFTAVSSDGTSKEVTVTITGTNDAPVLADTSLAIAAVLQGSGVTPTGVKGILVSDLVGGITDADTGAAKGIAITGVNTAKGQLYYSLDGGTNWTELTDATLSNARLLKSDADNRIYFKPAAGTLGDVTDAITFRAWDTTTGTDGQTGNASVNDGTTAFSKDSDTVSEYVVAPVTINAVSVDNLIGAKEPVIFTGKADPNATVTLNINGQAATATADGAGNWTYDASKVRYIMVRKSLMNLASSDPEYNLKGIFTVGEVEIYERTSGENIGRWGAVTQTYSNASQFTTGSLGDGNSYYAAGRYVETSGSQMGLAAGVSQDAWVQIDLGGTYALRDIKLVSAENQGARMNGATIYTSMTNMSSLTREQLDASPLVNSSTPVSGVTNAGWQGSWASASAINGSPLSEGANTITASELVRGVSSQATATVTLDATVPQAVADEVTGNEDTASLSGTVAANDTNKDGTEIFELVSSNTGTYGSLLFNDDGSYTYTRTANLNAISATATDTFTYKVTDAAGNITQSTLKIALSPVNDAPVLVDTAVDMSAVIQGAAVPTGAVGTLVSALVGGVSDVDAAAVKGIAITGVNSAKGSVYFSTDGGANWTELTSVSEGNARLLAADADNRVYFKAASTTQGNVTDAITFRAWDTTTGTDGQTGNASVNDGTTAFSKDSDTVSEYVVAPVTINAVSVDNLVNGSEPLVITGKADPGATVAVNINNHVFNVTANAAGEWSYDSNQVRYVMVRKSTGGIFAFTEVQAYSGGVNVALNKNANMLGQYPTGAIVDNDVHSFAFETASGDQWIQIDLAGYYNLDSVKVSARHANDEQARRLHDAVIYTSSQSMDGMSVAQLEASAFVHKSAPISGLSASSYTYTDNAPMPASGNILTVSGGNVITASELVRGVSSQATATVTLDATVPQAVADEVTGNEDTASLSGTVAANDTNKDGTEIFELVSSNTGTYGSLLFNDDGSYTYTRTANLNAISATATDTFTYKVTDAAGNITQSTLKIALSPVNDAPVLVDTAVDMSAVIQGAAVPTGAVGTLVSALVGGVSDVDAAAVKGIAITGVNSAKGTVYFSTDGGANWTELTSVSEGNARLLAADADNRVYFKAASSTQGNVADALTFRAWDTTTGTDGQTGNASVNDGTTAFSKDSDTVSEYVVAPVTINAVSVDNLIGAKEPVIFTGKADPNAAVTLNINGQTATATADGAGNWTYDASKVRYIMVRKSLMNLASSDPEYNLKGIFTVGEVEIYERTSGENIGRWGAVTQTYSNASQFTTGSLGDGNAYYAAGRYVETSGSQMGLATGVSQDAWVQIDLGGTYALRDIKLVSAENTGARMNGATIYTSMTDMSSLTRAQLDASPLVNSSTPVSGVTNSGWQGSWASASAINGSPLNEGVNTITASELVRGVSSQATATVTLDATVPQAVADEVTGNEDSASLTGTVASNDTSKDGTEAYTLEGSSNGTLVGTHGTLQLNPNGTYTYTRTANLNAISATATDTFTYKVTDAAGNSTTATLTVKMDPVNDAAVIAGDLTKSMTETNAVQSTTGTLSITDVDSPLTFAAQTDTAGTGGYGKFSLTTAGVWTYTLNTAHDEFEAGQNYTDKFTVVSSDGTSKEVSVTIAGTNDAPTLSSSSTAFSSFTENGGAVSAKSGTITLADVDSANLQGATVSVVDFVDGSTFYTGDVLTWTVPSGASITGNYNTSTGVLNFTGTATKAQYEQLLNSVMFNNQREDLAGGARKVYWSVTDTSGQASVAGPYSTVSVNKLNDAPVLANTALSLTAVQPATADVAPVGALGVLVSSLVGGVTDADGTAVTKGIAIIAANEALGKVYFSVNGGTNWYSPGFALASTAALLLKADANTRVYFRPNVGVEGEITDALTIRAWDATDNKPTINGTNVYQYNIATTGGVTPFSSETDTVSLRVASTASAGFAGTAGNNVMTGTAANEVMVGSGGADQINGGGGNDKIVLNADNVTQLSAANSANINGGSGINTLKLTGESMMLDLSNVTVQGKVDNFSTVDITGSGNNTLKLNLLNVQTLSGVTDNAATTDVNEAQMLVVQGNAGDAVVLENTASWATLVGLTGSSLSALYGADYGFVGTHKYTQYSKNGASVFVDELTPVADIVGTSGNDVLTGTSGADVLFGNGGADQISAGAGNDTVVLNASGLNALSVANTASLNGDAGVNVLKLSGTNMMLDLTNITVQAKVSNFSVLDLRQGNANKVKLNLQEVLDLSGGTDNAATVGVDESQMLVVQGNGGAQVNAVQLVGGLTWTAVTNLGGTTLQNTYGAQYGFEVGHSYTQYTSGSANLFVDQSLIQTML